MVEQTLPVHMGSWRTAPGHHPLWEEVVPTRSCSRNHDLGPHTPEYVPSGRNPEARSNLVLTVTIRNHRRVYSVGRPGFPDIPTESFLWIRPNPLPKKYGTPGWKPPHRPRGQVGTSDKEWHVILAVWHDSGHGLEDGGTSEGERRPAEEGRAGPPQAGRGGGGDCGPRRGRGCRADSDGQRGARRDKAGADGQRLREGRAPRPLPGHDNSRVRTPF